MAPMEKKAADRCSICKLHILTLESRAETTFRLVPLVPMVPVEKWTVDRYAICKA